MPYRGANDPNRRRTAAASEMPIRRLIIACPAQSLVSVGLLVFTTITSSLTCRGSLCIHQYAPHRHCNVVFFKQLQISNRFVRALLICKLPLCTDITQTKHTHTHTHTHTKSNAATYLTWFNNCNLPLSEIAAEFCRCRTTTSTPTDNHQFITSIVVTSDRKMTSCRRPPSDFCRRKTARYFFS